MYYQSARLTPLNERFRRARDREEAEALKEGVRGYQDPALRRYQTLLEFLLRLHDSQMLGSTDRAESEIDFFAVVKSTEEVEEGSSSVPLVRRRGSAKAQEPERAMPKRTASSFVRLAT